MRIDVQMRVVPQEEYIKLVLANDRLVGALLIGDTGLEETFENLILSQVPVADIDLLDPDFDVEDFFD